jgi:hypothetical protein
VCYDEEHLAEIMLLGDLVARAAQAGHLTTADLDEVFGYRPRLRVPRQSADDEV